MGPFLILSYYHFHFKGTLRLYAPDRLTADQCIQHEAFAYINQKQQQQQQKRLQRQQSLRP